MAAKKTYESPHRIGIEDMLGFFVDTNGICKICGHDHSYNPKFDDVASSIDIISKLFKKRKFQSSSKYDFNK